MQQIKRVYSQAGGVPVNFSTQTNWKSRKLELPNGVFSSKDRQLNADQMSMVYEVEKSRTSRIESAKVSSQNNMVELSKQQLMEEVNDA